MSRKLLNFKDVYDDAELKSHSPNLRFLQEVDKRTGERVSDKYGNWTTHPNNPMANAAE